MQSPNPPSLKSTKIAIIGLGYVGLPLALEFGKKYPTIGFDINPKRIQSLQNSSDTNEQIHDFKTARFLTFSHDADSLKDANTYIIAVPTPVDTYKKPDISLLLDATKLIAQYLKKGDLVIYESTTYPTCTKKACVPLLESTSSLRFNEDFFVGYSPERINPGDTKHTLTNITKITSGSTPQAAATINALYQSIIKTTYLAPSIEVAEAAKAIENAQRDLNIAFVNELSIIFDKLNIPTFEVLKAAQTKWNFLPFTPGLVGGHCISVDPYYLTHISNEYGYHPKVISSGRFINDMMPSFIAQKLIKLLAKHQINPIGARIAIFGASFKENCKDIRNAKVFEVYSELREYGCEVQIFDPLVEKDEVRALYGIELADSRLLEQIRLDSPSPSPFGSSLSPRPSAPHHHAATPHNPNPQPTPSQPSPPHLAAKILPPSNPHYTDSNPPLESPSNSQDSTPQNPAESTLAQPSSTTCHNCHSTPPSSPHAPHCATSHSPRTSDLPDTSTRFDTTPAPDSPHFSNTSCRFDAPHLFDACLLAIAHDIFATLDFQQILSTQGFIFDLKDMLPNQENIYKL